MTAKEKNDILYVCALIEYTARKTNHRNSDIVKLMGVDELAWQLKYADVSHSMPFEETSDEVIEKFNIKKGDFDRIGRCKFEIPNYVAIAGVYARLVANLIDDFDDAVPKIYDVFTSFISDEISNFNTSTFYENPSFIYHSYLKGELVD